MHQPLNLHLCHLKRVMRYVQATKNYDILIVPTDLHIMAYCDSDWAGDTTDMRSTTEYCVFFGTVPILWVAKKHTSIAHSFIEAKYRALAFAAVELTWIHQLLAELAFPLLSLTLLYYDTFAAISLAHNPVIHANTKDIDVNCHFIRGCIRKNHISLHYISSSDQVADILSKLLNKSCFHALPENFTTTLVSQFEGK